jgi:hypothetical protein
MAAAVPEATFKKRLREFFTFPTPCGMQKLARRMIAAVMG